jgi:malate dehydrogenase (oxaloacetate-decarboxylating)
VIKIDQTNNSYIFPGVGLGVVAVNARRITDNMFMAAATALAAMSPSKSDSSAELLPPIGSLRAVACHVAAAVARAAQADGMAACISEEQLQCRLQAYLWRPTYRPYRVQAAAMPGM